jgi:ATP-binding protein involved in chromosome partitioning
MADRDDVVQILKKVKFPGVDRDIVSLGYVKSVQSDDGIFRILVEITSNQPHVATAVERDIHYYMKESKIPYDLQVNVKSLMAQPTGSPMPQEGTHADPLASIPNKVAVSSAKGGVGKSTVAVNLALALVRSGVRVGLLDADIHGPSIPMMMGIQSVRPDMANGKLLPVERYGVKTISIGLLIETDAAVIWRGPMVGKALEQLMGDVEWGDIDLLLLDLPPGTGDIQITLSQQTALSGGIVVTTPQDVALQDAIRGVTMFQRVNVPVLGIVENMSYFLCPHCNEKTYIFGSGGGRREAQNLGVPLLCEIPIEPRISQGGDKGFPIVVQDPDSPVGQIYAQLAESVRTELGIEGSRK